MDKRKTGGWKNERYAHSLCARGVKVRKSKVNVLKPSSKPTFKSVPVRDTKLTPSKDGATFSIRFEDMDDWKKIADVEKALSDYGVSFDTGTGRGYRDWELDWSLEGAKFKKGALTISAGSRKDEEKVREIIKMMKEIGIKVSPIFHMESDKSSYAHKISLYLDSKSKKDIKPKDFL